MPKFITNIEIEDASLLDFGMLQNQMHSESFREIKKPESYFPEKKFINTSYNISGNYSLVDVIVVAKNIVSKLNKKFSVTVYKNKIDNSSLFY